MLAVVLLSLAVLTFFASTAVSRPTENERVDLWFRSNNTWPPSWQPETPAFREAMRKREEELLMLPGASERWENFMQYTQSRLVPRFTEKGFDVIPTPSHLQTKLKAALDKALQNFDQIRNEPQIDAVYTPIPSKFVDLKGLDWELIQELKEAHENWSGMKLIPTSAYGLRLYRNGSSLVMHYDKVHTHVISSIIHVGHEYDEGAEEWPIEIEDHDGKMHGYNLQPGEMLFYESAACLHGRRRIFKGKYYASIFVHYRPVDESVWNYNIDDVIANVPPHWRRGVIEESGSRWAGQGLTIDSRVTDGAPPRVINGEVVDDIREYYNRHNIPHSSIVHNAKTPHPWSNPSQRDHEEL